MTSSSNSSRILLFFIFVVSSFIVQSVKLPSYLKRCQRNDPEFDACALKSGKAAIKHLINGDKSFRVPPLSPFKIPFLQLENTKQLNLNMTDILLSGLEKSELTGLHADFKNQNIQMKFYVSEMRLKGQYHINGRVLILPIQGEGLGDVNILGGNYTYGLTYSLYDKRGVKYAKVEKNTVNFNLQRATMHLENLFNGDKRLGAEMNKFLNANWEEVLKEFKPAISATMEGICYQYSKRIFELVPYDEVFLNK